MMPGMPERPTHSSVRHGLTSLFAALGHGPSGTVIGALHRRHRSTEYRTFLITIDQAVPTELDVHVICDNYATHTTDTIGEMAGRAPTLFPVHVIPTSSSWLTMVQRWFGELTTTLLQRGVHKSVHALKADIRNWITLWNEDPRPYVWTKTADDILESLKTLVIAVSGPVTSGLAAGGCHRLARDGALLVTCTEEVLEAVGRIGLALAAEPSTPARPTDGLAEVVASVHDALPARAARETRWLAMKAGVPIDAVGPRWWSWSAGGSSSIATAAGGARAGPS